MQECLRWWVMFVNRNIQLCQHSASCRSLRHTFESSTATATALTCSVVMAVWSQSAMEPTAHSKQTKSSSVSIQFPTCRYLFVFWLFSSFFVNLLQTVRLIIAFVIVLDVTGAHLPAFKVRRLSWPRQLHWWQNRIHPSLLASYVS